MVVELVADRAADVDGETLVLELVVAPDVELAALTADTSSSVRAPHAPRSAIAVAIDGHLIA